VIRTKNGELRFCVDYRKLSDVTKKDCFPLPRIDNTLVPHNNLKIGYWHVIYPGDREKTAFSTGQGLWQFTGMPFGLCNAPAAFERLMKTVLRGLTNESCLVYLDDVIATGRTYKETLLNLRKCFRGSEKPT
jgi:hypothetical protein